MSNELRTIYGTGEDIFVCILRKTDGKVWYPVGVVFETWGTGSRGVTDYNAGTLDEVASGSGYYIGDFPTAITTEGEYDAQLRVTGIDDPMGILEIDWTGATATEDEVVSNTWTDFCNYALSKVGAGSNDNFRILNVTDTSNDNAILCAGLYPVVRKEVLCRSWFPEATKYADLGAERSGIAKADWEYAFKLPSDYLGKAQQIDESFHRSTKARYTSQYDKEIVSGLLFTNSYSNVDQDSAYIRYVWNLTDPTKLTPSTYETMAVKMAAELSPALLNDEGGTRRYFLIREYEELVLPLAEGLGREQSGDDEERGGYSAISNRNMLRW